jgi:protein ImuA
VAVVTGGLLGTVVQAGDFVGFSAGWHRGDVVPTGFAPLDRLLPAGGVRRGSLVEWLSGGEASGAAALACAVACRLAGEADRAGDMPSTIVVVDRTGRFYPPAVLGWFERARVAGLPAPRLVVARPAHDADEVWAIDQALRCRGVAAVVAWPARIHSTAMRRWQLAARASLAVGMFMRPLAAQREPSWAEARIVVTARPGGSLAARRLRLALAGGPWAGEAQLQERSVEIGLDLACGGEAILPPEAAAPRVHERERVACRAS